MARARARARIVYGLYMGTNNAPGHLVAWRGVALQSTRTIDGEQVHTRTPALPCKHFPKPKSITWKYYTFGTDVLRSIGRVGWDIFKSVCPTTTTPRARACWQWQWQCQWQWQPTSIDDDRLFSGRFFWPGGANVRARALARADAFHRQLLSTITQVQ